MASYRAKPPRGVFCNWGDPLAYGLGAAFLLNERAGLKVYDGTGKTPAGTLTNGPAWGSGVYGAKLAFVSGSSQYVATGYKQKSARGAVAALVRHTGLVTARAHVASVNFNGSNVPLDLNLGGDGAFTSNGFGFYDGGWRKSSITTDIRGDGLWHLVGGDYDGSTVRYILDGKVDSTLSYTGSMSTTNANVLDIGRYQSDTTYFTGDIALVMVWGRALKDAEWRILNTDPFRLFRRRRLPVPLKPAAAAGGFKPAWANRATSIVGAAF